MLNDASVLSLRPRFSARAIPGEGTFLVSELEQFVLEGRLAHALMPLLDGTRSRDDIVACLDHQFPIERILFGLKQLEERGYIYQHPCEAKPNRAEAGYWDLFRLHTRSTPAREARTVGLTIMGEIPTAPTTQILASLGIATDAASADVQLILTDDYLRPELEDFNEQALASGQAWVLAKPTGSTLWIGPFFGAGQGPCWKCMAQRIRLNQQVQSYVAARENNPLVTGPLVMTTPSLAAGLSLSALLATQMAASLDEKERETILLTLNTCTWQLEQHFVTKRPQCSACGDSELYARRQMEPPRIADGPTLYREGGLRSREPRPFLEEHKRHISTISGVVSKLERVKSVSEAFHTYSAGHNFGQNMHSLHALRQGLRSQSGGKGETDEQARASALGEAIERYSAVFHGDEARRRASFRELGDQAIHPNACLLFSERQYRERNAWNERDSFFTMVPEPFDPERKIEWSPVWSLTRQEWRYLPTSHLYYWYRSESGDPIYSWADSNGNAAGTSLEDAMLQGFCELIERDSVALWWYNRIQRPQIDLASFSHPFFEKTVETYRKIGRSLWVLDLTSDLGIPAVAAISHLLDAPTQDIMLAFGAHFDVEVAISRAMTELNQFLPGLMAARECAKAGGNNRMHDGADAEQRRWWDTATLDNQGYLRPSAASPRTKAHFPEIGQPTLYELLARAQKLAQDQGSELLLADQTRPDIGVPVVKVMIPGLRHFWARFAPGRLYDAPVKVGWLEAPLAESALNPIPMFI